MKFAQVSSTVAQITNAHIRMVVEVGAYNFYLGEILRSVEGTVS